MADTGTLRREFEAAYAGDPNAKHREYGSDLFVWNEHGNHYRYEHTQTAFEGFCLGRQASQAEIERLKQFEECYTRARQYIIDNGLQVTTPSDGDFAEPVHDVLHSQRTEIERLQSIVDRIPKFADGSPALPGDLAWHPEFVKAGSVFNTLWSIMRIDTWKPLSECYPTREAMEKANV